MPIAINDSPEEPEEPEDPSLPSFLLKGNRKHRRREGVRSSYAQRLAELQKNVREEPHGN